MKFSPLCFMKCESRKVPQNVLFISLVFVFLVRHGFAETEYGKYADHWVMKINGDLNMAKQVAREHSFKIMRPIGGLDGYYMVKLDQNRHKRDVNELLNDQSFTETLKTRENMVSSNKNVEIFQREKILVRRKRDFIELGFKIPQQRNFIRQASQIENIKQDPYWKEMWYLNRHSRFNDLPDMNVSSAWAMGYSGRGVSVTFLDDGLEWVNEGSNLY
jgi:hypothetical protein